MSHWAELDENNVVLRVTVGDNDDPNGDEGYQWLIDNAGGRWVKTSYNGSIRKRFAGIGMIYDEQHDAFLPRKPFPSSILDEETLEWKAPKDRPDSGTWQWDEASVSWVERTPTPQMTAIIGFPRSGNNFLAYAFAALAKQDIPALCHSVAAMQQHDKVYVPVRHPLDCIASWSVFCRKYQSNAFTLIDDINFYKRFMTAVIDLGDKAVPLYFDEFTKDIAYIANVFGIAEDATVTVESVTADMVEDSRELFLPQGNADGIDEIKAQLSEMPEFAECVILYEQMLTLAKPIFNS